MKLSLFFILFLLPVAYAQVTTVFDRNCEGYAREKKFISPKSVLDLDKNTERYFIYDNLTPSYGKMVDEVNKFAPGYYKTPDRAPIHACPGTALNKCLSFQAYCTETIAKAAVREDLAEWKVVATNCQNPKYRAKNPLEHCQNDAIKQLQYVYDQTLWLAKYEGKKNPDAARFFKESAQEFAKYRDNLKALLAEQEKLEQKRKDDLHQKELQKELAQSMKNCSDIVKADDNDVESRNLVGRVVVGIPCKDSLVNLDQPALNELKNDMDNILDHINTKEVLDQTNEIALEKTATAFWASKRQLEGKDLSTEQQAIDLLCQENKSLCENPKSRKNLINSYRKTKQKLLSVPILNDSETNRLLQSEFNPLLKGVNDLCQKVNHEWKELLRQRSSERMAEEKERYSQKSLYLREQNLAVADNTRVVKKFNPDFAVSNELLTAAHGSLQNKFSELLNSKLGHLMMSKSLQEKVGTFNPENFRKECAGGSGQLLKPATLSDMKIAKEDVKELINNELDKVSDDHEVSGGLGRKEALETYLKNNPLTIAELLRKNPSPEYANLMCHLIRDINSKDQNWSYFKTGVAVVGTVASIALAATGVGAPAGAALFALVTSTTLVSGAASLDDYFTHKQESTYALQSGATNQDTRQGAINVSAQQDEKAGDSFKEFAQTVVLEAAGFGAGKVIKHLKNVKASGASHLVNASDEVIETSTDMSKVSETVLNKVDDIKRGPATKLNIENQNFEKVQVEVDVPKVRVKTRPATVKSASRLDFEKMTPSQQRYYKYIEEVDPLLERKIVNTTETSSEKLAQMYANNNPKDVDYLLQKGQIKRFTSGGEADIYVGPNNRTEALKIWHANRLDDFELSTKTVMHFEKKVEQNSKIAEVFQVSKIKQKGPNYIVKEFFPNSTELAKVKNLPEVKNAIKKLNQELLKNSDVLSQRLYQNILKGSENIHWDPTSQKIVLIDALGF